MSMFRRKPVELRRFEDIVPMQPGEGQMLDSNWHLLWIWPLRLVYWAFVALFFATYPISNPLARWMVRRGWFDFMQGGHAGWEDD
jgi:hypothetical protein